jgi:hypothetical protein
MIRPVAHRLTKRITELGGKAENGLPLFRVMRGCDRFTWIGGEWKHYDTSGNETGSHVGLESVLKHPEAKDRYIFEVLCPPENYGTPEKWKEAFTQCINGQFLEVLGPFPREGEYELVRVIKTPKTGAFVPLTEAICDALVATAKLNRELPARIRVEAARDRRAKEEKDKDQRMIDKLDSMAPAFEGKTFVNGARGYVRHRAIELKAASTANLTLPTSKEISQYG